MIINEFVINSLLGVKIKGYFIVIEVSHRRGRLRSHRKKLYTNAPIKRVSFLQFFQRCISSLRNVTVVLLIMNIHIIQFSCARLVFWCLERRRPAGYALEAIFLDPTPQFFWCYGHVSFVYM